MKHERETKNEKKGIKIKEDKNKKNTKKKGSKIRQAKNIKVSIYSVEVK